MWPENPYGKPDSAEFAEKLGTIQQSIDYINMLKDWLVKEIFPAYKNYLDAQKNQAGAEEQKANRSLQAAAKNYIGNPLSQIAILLESGVGTEYDNYCAGHRIQAQTSHIRLLAREFDEFLNSNIIAAKIRPFRLGSELDIIWDALNKFRQDMEAPKDIRLKGPEKPMPPLPHKGPPSRQTAKKSRH